MELDRLSSMGPIDRPINLDSAADHSFTWNNLNYESLESIDTDFRRIHRLLGSH